MTRPLSTITTLLIGGVVLVALGFAIAVLMPAELGIPPMGGPTPALVAISGLAVLVPLTGIALLRPVGFRSANWDLSWNTVEIIAGLGFEYDSSLMADEDCYELLVDGKPTGVVEIPVEWLRDDAVYLMFNREPATRPWMSPEDVFGVFKRELDVAHEMGGLFQVVMHPFVIGYRSRLWILERLISHALKPT